jgi:acyl-CoA reductase-like NAD-dependent aldehyde dehydrogenase
VYNPATGDLVSDEIPVAGEEDVNDAVAAANAAFSPASPWRQMTVVDRQRILLKFADILEFNREHLAHLTRLTLGAPFHPFGKGEIDTAIGCFRCTFRLTVKSRVLGAGLKLTAYVQTMLAGLTNSEDSHFQQTTASTKLFATNPSEL